MSHLMSFKKPIKVFLSNTEDNRRRRSMNEQTETDTGYFDRADCDLGVFTALINQAVTTSNVPNAGDIQKNVPIYDV